MQRHLDHVKHAQDYLRAHESQARYLLTSNADRVDTWSAVSVGVFVTVAVLQVIAVRRFFRKDDKGKA